MQAKAVRVSIGDKEVKSFDGKEVEGFPYDDKAAILAAQYSTGLDKFEERLLSGGSVSWGSDGYTAKDIVRDVEEMRERIKKDDGERIAKMTEARIMRESMRSMELQTLARNVGIGEPPPDSPNCRCVIDPTMHTELMTYTTGDLKGIPWTGGIDWFDEVFHSCVAQEEKPDFWTTEQDFRELCGTWVDDSDGDVMKIVPQHGIDECSDGSKGERRGERVSLSWWDDREQFLWVMEGYKKIEAIPEQCIPKPVPPVEYYVKKWKWL